MRHLDPIVPLSGPASDADTVAPLQHFLKYAQMDAGAAPLLRLEEHAREATLEPRLAQLRSRWPEAHVAVLEPTWSRGGTRVVLVARSEELLRKGARVERVLWNGPGDPRFGAAMVALGRLLGFPRCCVEALARAGASRTEEVERLRVCRALRAGRAMAPAFLVPTVPCRPDCPRLQRLVDAIATDAGGWISRWASTYGHVEERWERWRELPALLYLDRPGQLSLLRVGAESEGRLTYEAVLTFCADPRAERVARGSALRLAEGSLAVDPPAADATFAPGEVVLLGPEGPYDPAYWRATCD